MGLVDHDEKVIVNYSYQDVFSATKHGLDKLDGFTVDRIDEKLGCFYLKAGVSLFSWGENITVTLVEMSDKRTQIAILSSPKTGAMFGGAMDMGKNRKNIDAIFNCISHELENYDEISTERAIELDDNDIAAKLKKLQQLFNQTLITQEEYDSKKKELLAEM